MRQSPLPAGLPPLSLSRRPMKTLSLPVLAAVLTAVSSAQTQAPPAEYVRDATGWLKIQYGQSFRVDPSVVTVRFAAPLSDLNAFRAAAAAAGVDDPLFAQLQTVRHNHLGIHDLAVPEGADVLDVVARLRATGLVDFADETTFGAYTVDPNDPLYGQQWNFKNTGQNGGTPDADIDADLAWDIERGDPSVVIAVIDSGTEITHSDLASTVWVNPGEIPGNGIDDEGNGFVDDVNGWDFEFNNNDPSSNFFHGTFVAGMCAASSNNGNKLAGLAGGFGPTEGCRYLPCGVGQSFPIGSVLDDAIIYAADNGARVITLSLSVAFDSAIESAISYAHNVKGVFIDDAAGNNGFGGVSYPATNPLVIAVGATTNKDARASFSSVGPEVFVSAPGDNVIGLDLNDSTTTSSGTSFSSPQVAGLAGLLISYTPTLSNTSVADILRITAEDKGVPGKDNDFGWGRINAHDALVHLAANDCNGNGYYDPQEIADGITPDINGNGIPDDCEGPIVLYCTPKASSAGCVATLTTSDFFNSPISGANDYSLIADTVQAKKPGLFFFGTSGQASLPFSGGTLCVAPPNGRTPVQQSGGGGSLSCTGQMTLVINDGNGPPNGPDVGPGNTVWMQLWYRDPNNGPGTLGTALSGGVEIPFQ